MARHPGCSNAGGSGAAAVLIGYPCFRFRITGHNFALLTLALSAIVLQVVTASRDLTGGSLGYTPEALRWRQLDLCPAVPRQDDLVPDRPGGLGRRAGDPLPGRPQHAAIRAGEAFAEDEDAAAAAGVHVTAEKLKITVLSAMMTAFAGALCCQYQMFTSPDTVMASVVSLQMVFAAVAGKNLRAARAHAWCG